MRLPKNSFFRSLGALLLSVSLPLWSGVAEAKNPFLSAISDDRALATFSGTEWGDEIGRKELPFSARVVTTRIAKLAWGEVYQIAFESIRSQTGKPRTLSPLYFVTTDKEIFRLTADKPDEAVAKLKGLSGPPKFEPSELYGLSAGSRTYKETGLTVAKVVVKGSRCLYTWNHNSGHFMTVEWQSGLGLTEIAQGRGARADGYRLRRGAGLGR